MKSKEKISVLVADDHFLVRMGLSALVKTEPNIEVVAEAADGDQAVQSYADFQPDLVLMDLRMPVKDGVQATTEIRHRFPAARILMLTTFDGDEDIHRALEAGAQGYVLKNSTGETLIPALRAIAAGQHWIPKEVATRLAFRKTFQELTDREVEVLQELAKGLANKEIAAILHITEYTVKDHLKNIFFKLRVADRTEAVTVAIQRGVIHL
jgi:DNA-binding NarL/FixJ family response regulator